MQAIIRLTLDKYDEILSGLSKDLTLKPQSFALSEFNDILLLTETSGGGNHSVRWFSYPAPEPEPQNSFVAIDVETEAIYGKLNYKGSDIPITKIEVVGPGFLRSVGSSNISPKMKEIEDLYFSRTRGVFGSSAWSRTRHLDVSVLGASGVGSWLVVGLTKMGIGKIKVWDPDILEEHHFSRTPYEANFLKRQNKAKALVEWLNMASPLTEYERLTTSLVPFDESPLKIRKYLKRLALSDLIIVAVDSDVARAFAGIIGSLFLIPVMDIALGIGKNREGVRITWMWPYETDIFCLLPELKRKEVLKGLYTGNERHNEWYKVRRGSYIGLILSGVGLSLSMLKKVIVGDVVPSNSLVLEWGENSLETKRLTSRNDCGLRFFMGEGILGLEKVVTWLRSFIS